MNALEIPRVSFVEAESLTSTHVELAEKANRLLGYSKLAKSTMSSGSLLGALKSLSIEPLLLSKVEEYKRSKAKNGMWSGHKESFVWLAIFAASLYTSLEQASVGDFPHGDIHVGAFFTFLALSIVFLWRGLFMLFYWDARGQRTTRSWKRKSIQEYQTTGTIPDHVLYKAIQIKEHMPEAQFEIEQLVLDREKTIIPDPDPFLVVNLYGQQTVSDRYGDSYTNPVVVESYYIEVWDERDFEKTVQF